MVEIKQEVEASIGVYLEVYTNFGMLGFGIIKYRLIKTITIDQENSLH
jgi:hypothetical protein